MTFEDTADFEQTSVEEPRKTYFEVAKGLTGTLFHRRTGWMELFYKGMRNPRTHKATIALLELGFDAYNKLLQWRGDVPQELVERRKAFFHAMNQSIISRLGLETADSILEKMVEPVIRGRLSELDGIRRELTEDLGRPPNFVVVQGTEVCNYKCHGCSAASDDGSSGLATLPARLFHRTLDDAKSLGLYYVVVTGGETLAYKSEGQGFLDIVKAHPDQNFMFFTNASMMGRATIDKIVELGNAIPSISIEGGKAETDARRIHPVPGVSPYDIGMDAAEYLRKKKALFGFSITLTRENYDVVTSDAFAADLFENRGANVVWFFHFAPLGNVPDPGLEITPEQRRDLYRAIHEQRKKGRFIIDFGMDSAIAGFYEKGQPVFNGCLASNFYYYVDARGDINPCVFVTWHVPGHNIEYMSAREVMMSPFFRAIREEQTTGDRNSVSPCLLRDKPWVLKKLVEEHGAVPSHNAENTLCSPTYERVCDIARGYRAVGEEICTQAGIQVSCQTV